MPKGEQDKRPKREYTKMLMAHDGKKLNRFKTAKGAR